MMAINKGESECPRDGILVRLSHRIGWVVEVVMLERVQREGAAGGVQRQQLFHEVYSGCRHVTTESICSSSQ